MFISNASYPHIVDLILFYAFPQFPASTLLGLRLLSKHTRRLVSVFLYSHVCISDPGSHDVAQVKLRGLRPCPYNGDWLEALQTPSPGTRVLDFQGSIAPHVGYAFLHIFTPQVLRFEFAHEQSMCADSSTLPSSPAPDTLVKFNNDASERFGGRVCLSTALSIRKIVLHMPRLGADHWSRFYSPRTAPKWPKSVEEAVVIVHEPENHKSSENDYKKLLHVFRHLILSSPSARHVFVGLDAVHPGYRQTVKGDEIDIRQAMSQSVDKTRREEGLEPLEPLVFLSMKEYRDRVGEKTFALEMDISMGDRLDAEAM